MKQLSVIKWKWNILMSILMLFLICSINGCGKNNNSNNNQIITVDITKVLQFTDEKIALNGLDIEERSISQHTNNKAHFLVEYWGKINSKNHQYGYYIQINNNKCEIIKEGKNVDKSVFAK